MVYEISLQTNLEAICSYRIISYSNRNTFNVRTTLSTSENYFKTEHFRLITPILMGKVTAYFTPGQTEISSKDAWIYTAELVALLLFYNTYNNVYLLLINEMSFKVKIACSSLLYRKCLKLNQMSMDKFPNGLVITMLTKDVSQFEGAFDMIVVLINGILQIILLTYLTYTEIGAATFCGLGFMLLLFPFHGKNCFTFFVLFISRN